MSYIENIVIGELANYPDLVATDNGFSWERGGGTTTIWFSPVSRTNDREPISIAHVETDFNLNFEINDEFTLAQLNSRSCFGSYFSRNNGLGLRLTYCIYADEPAAKWVAVALLRAMGEQLALGHGIAESIISSETLAVNRANLEYPRKWKSKPTQRSFDVTVTRFRELGLTTNCDARGMVLELPLAGHHPSRMVDHKAETALLHVWGSVTHPIAGVGYAAAIALPIDPAPINIPWWTRYLNETEHSLYGFVPRLGSWGVRGCGNELVYTLFWPTDHSDDGLVGTIMNWMVQRTHWLKSNYWEPGKGLRIPGDIHE